MTTVKKRSMAKRKRPAAPNAQAAVTTPVANHRHTHSSTHHDGIADDLGAITQHVSRHPGAAEGEAAGATPGTTGTTTTTLDIESYCQGFYDCMSKYAIFAKGARRRIISTIRQRYKGDNSTKFVWKVK